jgi:formate hydrogenlyase subunit 6/NADH:ubiquinone oxidoreductase subunit I
LRFKNFGLGISKGLSVSFRYFFRHASVNQYPEQRLNISRRSRGNGCATCAKACPQGSIEIITSTNTQENKYKVETYRVDTGYCIMCGLCVEACPFDALFMGHSFERAKYRRDELVQANDELLESPQRPASGYFHPEIAEKLPVQTLLIEKIVEKRPKQ